MQTNVILRFCVFLTGQSIFSNIFIIQGHIQGQMLISRSSKQKYDFYQIKIGILFVCLILTENKSDTVFIIQGYPQCQKFKLNVLNVTKYDNIVIT